VTEPRKPAKKAPAKKVAAKRAAPSRGERGRQGEQGEQGVPGEAGLSIQGIEGHQGEQGEAGESVTGEQGLQGLRGRQGEPGIQGEPGKTVTTALDLTNALRDNTNALNAVKRRYRGTTAVAVFAMLGMLFSFYVRYDSRVSSCERDNQVRGGLQHVADTFDIQIAADPTPDPEDLAFVAQLREDFALRDCSEIGWI
jgi:collagen triple helix repeat protein